ncbi:MAG: hypothetical protein ABIN01_09055 [Ferruginibacter sp.]
MIHLTRVTAKIILCLIMNDLSAAQVGMSVIAGKLLRVLIHGWV